MEKPLGKIKVCFTHDPKRIISYLPKGYSKEETLDKIRPKINKMKENHLFVDRDWDLIDYLNYQFYLWINLFQIYLTFFSFHIHFQYQLLNYFLF